MTQQIGFVGGTGPLGKGLAARWARAGIATAIGSRSEERGQQAAAAIAELAGPGAAPVTGSDNLSVAREADLVVITVPFEGLDEALTPLADTLAGRIVVSAVNPLAFDRQGPYPIRVPEGSAAARIADRLPGIRLVAAYHSLSARTLAEVDQPMDDDVPIVGDDEEAVAEVVALTEHIAGCRPLIAGPLRLAGPVEDLTTVLLALNKRYKAHAGVRFSGVHPH